MSIDLQSTLPKMSTEKPAEPKGRRPRRITRAAVTQHRAAHETFARGSFPRRMLAVLGLACVLALVGLIAILVWKQLSRSGGARHTPLPRHAAAQIAHNQPAQYAGSASCRACHRAAYDAWAGSHHGLAERPIDPSLDRAAFDPPRTFQHATQHTSVAIAGGKYEISMRDLSAAVQAHAVVRVIGVDPLRQFLVDEPGGRLQATEAAYDPRKNEWFNVFALEDRQPGEWGHWTGRGMNWNSQCAACHNTRVHKNYDPASDSYHTTMAELSVSCEACHGPMKAHVDWQHARSGPAPRDSTAKRDSTAAHVSGAAHDPTVSRFTRDQQTDVCASCHSRRGELTGDFVPGQSFFDHYSLAIVDDSPTFYPDGQIKEEDYEWSAFLGSRMYAAGVRCGDCHDPHSGKTLLSDNALCLRCHANPRTPFASAPVIRVEAHTFHKPDSLGSRCVSCHMPQTTYMQRHGRHDHGFTTPDPLLTKELNIPNACNRCHSDQSADWALAAAERWYGAKLDRPARQRARAIAAARRGGAGAPGQLLSLLSAPAQSAYWQAVYAGLLGRWADDPPTVLALRRALQSASPLVRASAAAALAPRAQNDPAVASAFEGLLEDPSRNVRIAAAHALGPGPDAQARAWNDWQACLEQQADQPAGQLQLAMQAVALGQADEALAHLKKVTAWDPRSAPLRRDAAVLYGSLHNPREAMAQLEIACQLDPRDAEYPYLLGLAASAAGEPARAVAALERATQLDPARGRAWYNLGLARRDAGQVDAALDALKKGEAADPSDADIAYARALLLAQLHRTAEAREEAERVLRIRPGYRPAEELLRSLAAK